MTQTIARRGRTWLFTLAALGAGLSPLRAAEDPPKPADPVAIGRSVAAALVFQMLPPDIESALDEAGRRQLAERRRRVQGELATTVASWARSALADPQIAKRPAQLTPRLMARWTEGLSQAMLRRPYAERRADLERLARASGDGEGADDGDECGAGLAAALGFGGMTPPKEGPPEQLMPQIEQRLALIADIGNDSAPPPAPKPDFGTRMMVSALQAFTYPSSARPPLPGPVSEALAAATRGTGPAAPDASMICRLTAWWARSVLLKPESEQRDDLDALARSTVAGLPLLIDRQLPAEGGQGWNGSAPPGYPAVASRFGITGKTVVEVALDDEGRPVDARVLKRQVDVPGLDQRQSVAFDHVFDEAAISNALGRRYAKPPAKAGRPATDRVEFVWRLED